MQDKVLDEEDLQKFKDWLELNVESISWEGRHKSEFTDFWRNLFLPNKPASFHLKRISLVKRKAVSGPLSTWFSWLSDKFLCFCFLTQDMSLRELAKAAEVTESKASLILRDFFIERYPQLEDEINDRFLLGNVVSDNLYLKYEDLRIQMSLETIPRGALEDDIMKSLEVTLYHDWKTIFEWLKKMNIERDLSLDKLVEKAGFRRQVRFAREVLLLFLAGGLLIFGVKAGNTYYENYLVKKITLFEPDFFWLDKSLSFQPSDSLSSRELELSFRELDNLEQLESEKVFEEESQPQRFDGESDVSLASVDALPRDFTAADLERSSYEEVRKGGYRDSRYGRRSAYRVMMTSVNPKQTREKLLEVLSGFDVKQADNVKPGTEIPGGLYFNLYVQRKELKDFLSRVSEVEEATILESRTVSAAPHGSNKVFIWIKGI